MCLDREGIEWSNHHGPIFRIFSAEAGPTKLSIIRSPYMIVTILVTLLMGPVSLNVPRRPRKGLLLALMTSGFWTLHTERVFFLRFTNVWLNSCGDTMMCPADSYVSAIAFFPDQINRSMKKIGCKSIRGTAENDPSVDTNSSHN